MYMNRLFRIYVILSRVGGRVCARVRNKKPMESPCLSEFPSVMPWNRSAVLLYRTIFAYFPIRWGHI